MVVGRSSSQMPAAGRFSSASAIGRRIGNIINDYGPELGKIFIDASDVADAGGDIEEVVGSVLDNVTLNILPKVFKDSPIVEDAYEAVSQKVKQYKGKRNTAQIIREAVDHVYPRKRRRKAKKSDIQMTTLKDT